MTKTFRWRGWEVVPVFRLKPYYHVAISIWPPGRPFFGLAILKGTPPCMDWKDRTHIWYKRRIYHMP